MWQPILTDRQTDGHTPGQAPYQAVSWLLLLPSHCPSLVQTGMGSQCSAATQRTVQFSATWLPSASSSVSLAAGTRISGGTLQRSGDTAGRGFQIGKLIQLPAGLATVVAIPASLEKQALPRGSGRERCLMLFCNRLSQFSVLGQTLARPTRQSWSSKPDPLPCLRARGPSQIKPGESFDFAAYLPWCAQAMWGGAASTTSGPPVTVGPLWHGVFREGKVHLPPPQGRLGLE